MQEKNVGIIILCLIALVIFSFAVPVFSAKEPYETTETYTEEEPYETTEPYYDTETRNYEEEVPIEYDELKNTITERWDMSRGYYHEAELTLRNIDEEGGEFKVKFIFENPNSVQKEVRKSSYIPSGQSYTFKATYDSESGEDVSGHPEVKQPTKTVTKTKEVQVEKERTVTKTKEVEKTRTVTKVREVDATLYELLFKY